jgi:cation diffusion facilitator family transporter
MTVDLAGEVREKKKAALLSVGSAAVLVSLKAFLVLRTGSLGVLSEALHSGLDLVAAVITFLSVRVSDQPADENHPYGHGKFENFSAFVETALLLITALYIIFEAFERLFFQSVHIAPSITAVVVLAIALGIDMTRARALAGVVKRFPSEALEADALHFSSDMWSSIAVLLGLCGVALGYSWADAAAAVVVAVFICIAGWRLGRRTINTLTDTAPAGVSERVAAIARQVSGVVAVERVRARPAGAVLFVELGVAVSRTLPLDRVTAIKEQLTAAIRTELPSAEVTITTEAHALDDETVRERVMVIAHDLGLAIHHVAVQTIAGRLSVSTDLEVEGAQSLATAHEVATRLEQAVRDELGSDVEVETHIEPLAADVLSGRDASATRIGEVLDALSSLAVEIPDLAEIHEVRVRETPDGEIVNFHCRVDPALSVAAVHDLVDALERRLRQRFPAIRRVIGHAEPGR